MYVVTPINVSAQAPTGYYVGFQIQNLSSTQTATVLIQYYKQDGTGGSGDYQQTITIAANRSKTIICSLNSDLSSEILAPAPGVRGSSTFAGSVIISSDQPIASIANEAASVNNPYGSASYNGLSDADLSEVIYAPLIAKLGQPNTTINIQNPNSSQISVVVDYVPGTYGVSYTTPSINIEGYGSRIWEVPANALDTNGRFLGSAKITSTGGKIAVVVDAIFASNSPSPSRYNARQSYTAFKSGSTKAVAPLIQKNDGGVWYSGIQVMNLGPGDATVQITYNGKQGTGTDVSCNPTTDALGLTEPSFTLEENKSKTILTEFGGSLNSSALAGLDCFRGAANVEVTSGTGKVVVIVSVAGQNSPQVSYYRGFNPDLATSTIVVPLIEKYLGVPGANGWSTGVQIAHVGTGDAIIDASFNVTCNGSTETVTESSDPVPAGSSTTFLQLNGFPLGSLGTRQNCLGSAVFIARDSKPIVGIVNQSFFGSGNPFVGDVLLTFEAINQ
jgi:hypothetical protein